MEVRGVYGWLDIRQPNTVGNILINIIYLRTPI